MFPADLLTSSSLLAFAGVVVGFVIVHLGTVISIDDFIKQWRTVLTGIGAVGGVAAALFFIGSMFKGSDYVIAAIGAISGGTVSVVIIQEAALAVGLATVAVFPVLIAALQGLVGFPLTSVILRKEALRLRDEYRAGKLTPVQEEREAPRPRPGFLRPSSPPWARSSWSASPFSLHDSSATSPTETSTLSWSP